MQNVISLGVPTYSPVKQTHVKRVLLGYVLTLLSSGEDIPDGVLVILGGGVAGCRPGS